MPRSARKASGKASALGGTEIKAFYKIIIVFGDTTTASCDAKVLGGTTRKASCEAKFQVFRAKALLGRAMTASRKAKIASSEGKAFHKAKKLVDDASVKSSCEASTCDSANLDSSEAKTSSHLDKRITSKAKSRVNPKTF